MQICMWRKKIKKLQKKSLIQSAKIKKMRNLRNIKKKVNVSNEIASCNFLDANVRLFLEMQVIQRKSVSKWGIDQRLLAQNMFFKSAMYYNFMRELGFQLPSPSSLHRWLPVKQYLPGFSNKEAIFNFKFQLSELNCDSAKYAVITFDEMHCRAELEYNKKTDSIDGVVDDGHSRKDGIADQVDI